MTAMSHVDLETHINGRSNDRMDLAGLVDKPSRMTGERMGENVARLQQFDRAVDDGVGIQTFRALRWQCPQLAKMDIDWKVGLPADVACHFYYFGAPPCITADLGMSLHTLDKIAVCVGSR